MDEKKNKTMDDSKMAKIMIVIILAVSIALLVFVIINNFLSNDKSETGDIVIQEEEVPMDYADTDYAEQDKQEQDERYPVMLKFHDDAGVLSDADFLTDRCMLTINERLALFLDDAGYTSKTVTTVEDSKNKRGSTATWTCKLDDYDDMYVYIEAYGSTDTFWFCLYDDTGLIIADKNTLNGKVNQYVGVQYLTAINEETAPAEYDENYEIDSNKYAEEHYTDAMKEAMDMFGDEYED